MASSFSTRLAIASDKAARSAQRFQCPVCDRLAARQTNQPSHPETRTGTMVTVQHQGKQGQRGEACREPDASSFDHRQHHDDHKQNRGHAWRGSAHQTQACQRWRTTMPKGHGQAHHHGPPVPSSKPTGLDHSRRPHEVRQGPPSRSRAGVKMVITLATAVKLKARAHRHEPDTSTGSTWPRGASRQQHETHGKCRSPQ